VSPGFCTLDRAPRDRREGRVQWDWTPAGRGECDQRPGFGCCVEQVGGGDSLASHVTTSIAAKAAALAAATASTSGVTRRPVAAFARAADHSYERADGLHDPPFALRAGDGLQRAPQTKGSNPAAMQSRRGRTARVVRLRCPCARAGRRSRQTPRVGLPCRARRRSPLARDDAPAGTASVSCA
jgi:hypothetical protein